MTGTARSFLAFIKSRVIGNRHGLMLSSINSWYKTLGSKTILGWAPFWNRLSGSRRLSYNKLFKQIIQLLKLFKQDSNANAEGKPKQGRDKPRLQR